MSVKTDATGTSGVGTTNRTDIAMEAAPGLDIRSSTAPAGPAPWRGPRSNPVKFHFQYMAVKEEQCAKRLVPGRRRNAAFGRETGQKPFDFRFAHEKARRAVCKRDSSYPGHCRLSPGYAEVFQSPIRGICGQSAAYTVIEPIGRISPSARTRGKHRRWMILGKQPFHGDPFAGVYLVNGSPT